LPKVIHDSRINVLHLTETSEPGGSETVLANIANSLDPARYASLVCLLEEGWLTTRLADLGIEYVIIKNDRPYDPVFLMKLIRLIKSRNIDIIHAHEFMMNVYGATAGKISGVPMIGTVHCKLYFPEKRTRILSYKLAVALCSRMILVSEDLRKFFVDTLKLRNEKKLMTIYNGVDSDKYSGGTGHKDIRRELGILQESVVSCTVGSLFKVKGLEIMLEAAKLVLLRFPNFRLLIAGDGDQMAILKSKAEELRISDSIHFLGFRDDIPEILRVSDFYVCSSFSEGLSLSILEAMTAGKPVVATTVGGNPELVSDCDNGFLAPSADPQGLAEKMMMLIDNPGLRETMSRRSMQIARDKFSLKQMVENYQELYEELLKNR
jgi:glycosyltransferase involved in cell wall biosynthesis